MKLEYVANESDNNLMIKDIVKKRLCVSSRLYKKIVKDIRLNGQECYTSNRVKIGDRITVDLDNAYDKEDIHSKFVKWEHDLDIIYEDEYILCINKEKGVPCHPSAMHLERTLYNAIINYYIKKGQNVPIHFVNRLDKDTTGVVIVAKHKYIQEYLSIQIKRGEVTKKYIAVVYGKIEKEEGVIEKGIKRKEGSIILRETSDDKNADYAKTGYKVLKYNEKNNYTIVEVTLFTGRTHQIRVHFASIGHPLLGDELYSKECNINMDNVHKYIDRQALHAVEIKFNDLEYKEKLIKANMPKDMQNLCDKA